MGVLVRARWILTRADTRVLEDGAVAVEGQTIARVGPWPEVRGSYPRFEVVDASSSLLIPGLINAHSHFSEGLMVGLSDSRTLFEWIDRFIVPASSALDRRKARVGAALKAAEMALSGVTTVNDMFVCMPRPGDPVSPGAVEGIEDIGIKAEVSFGAQDRTGASLEAIRAEHQALAEAARGSGRCRFRMGLATVPSASDALMEATAAWADEWAAPLHIHLHEVREEVTSSLLRFGCTSVEAAARLGLFATGALAAHCVWVNERDMDKLAEHGVSVAHNPVANAILASGICPVGDLRRRGIAVGIGTDGAASNDSQDMLQAIKLAPLLAKLERLDPTVMVAIDVLTMATVEGARALGLEDRIGSIEVGKDADLVLIDLEDPSLAGCHDPVRALVYAAGPRAVTDVWVQGERIVRNRALTRVDLRELVGEATALARELARQARFLDPADPRGGERGHG
jgi:cytosine/adenosine deaminase-related metal-dependent hydrolase